MKHPVLALLIILISGCGGGSGDTPPRLGTSPQTKTAGVWLGVINSNFTVAVIAENGTSFVSDVDGTVLWTGDATIQNSDISISTTRYTNDINNGTSETLTATASGSTLTLNTPVGNGDLTYSALYENDSALTLTNGMWFIAGTALGDWTVNIDNNGTFSSDVFGNGCKASGQLSIIDSKFNPMALMVTLTQCSGANMPLNGNYSGLATLTDEAPGTNNSLSFAFANGVDDGFYFDDVRKQ